MALHGATLQQQLTVHNAGAEPMSKCRTTRVTINPLIHSVFSLFQLCNIVPPSQQQL